MTRTVGDGPTHIPSEIERALLPALAPGASRFVLGFGALLRSDWRGWPRRSLHRSAILGAELCILVVQLGHPPI